VRLHHPNTRTVAALVVALGLAAPVAAGCGGDGNEPQSADAAAGGGSSGARVLPVAKNPIRTNGAAPGLTITGALVENNVSPETGKDVPDHLEVRLKNTSAKPLDDIEIYYKIRDETKDVSEGYHMKLEDFVIRPGATRVAHFDDTGEKDHYPVNEYSLYYTDQNELFVDVMAAAPGAKPATFTARKDAASAEAGVEQD